MIEGIFWLMLLNVTHTPPAYSLENYNDAALHRFVMQGRNSISGSISDASRRPLQNLRVELLDDVDGVLASTYTNSAGQYFFQRLSAGVFQVRVLTGGTDYESRTERISLSSSLLGGGGQSEQLDFVLSVKKGRGGTAVAVTSAPGTVFVQEVPSGAREAYEQALKEINDDRSKAQALTNLQRAINLFPEYYAALDLLGKEYVRREDYTAAQPLLTKAVAVNPRSYSSWYALGYTQYKLKLFPTAAQSLDKSASLNAKSVNTYLLLGTVQRIQKHWSTAETNLKRAQSLSKASLADIHWQLALLYNQTERFADAANELETFLQAQPDSRDAEMIRKLIAELRKKK